MERRLTAQDIVSRSAQRVGLALPSDSLYMTEEEKKANEISSKEAAARLKAAQYLAAKREKESQQQ